MFVQYECTTVWKINPDSAIFITCFFKAKSFSYVIMFVFYVYVQLKLHAKHIPETYDRLTSFLGLHLKMAHYIYLMIQVHPYHKFLGCI